jgi:hypothetical protein
MMKPARGVHEAQARPESRRLQANRLAAGLFLFALNRRPRNPLIVRS